MLNQELIEKEFSFLKDVIYLNVSSVAMPPLRTQKAYGSYMSDYVADLGADFEAKAWKIVESTREKVAQLIHAEDTLSIAFVKNTCEGISILADGYPFQPGDNVILTDQEHESNLFPWINLHEKKGVELRIVKSQCVEGIAEEVISAIDSHTKVLSTFAVQYQTGVYADLEKIGQACAENNVIFAVDAIQALGRLKLDVRTMHIDWMAAGSNKGLLGTSGAGFVYCTPRIVDNIVPPYASWQSWDYERSSLPNARHMEWYGNAKRFESGNLNYNGINAIGKSVDLMLELGLEQIEAHIYMLEKYLREKLSELHVHIVQTNARKNWSGIVCARYPEKIGDQVAAILKKHKIFCTIRGGTIRMSLGMYNTLAQMEEVAFALHEIDVLVR